jgi:PIN domain nuclease of toxin-antitoxin system
MSFEPRVFLSPAECPDQKDRGFKISWRETAAMSEVNVHEAKTHPSKLPHHHKDPFDRLIISQAMIERIPIMTVDRQFEPYDVKLLWGN